MEFETVVDIAAPADRVWQVLADLVTWPQWTASVSAVTMLTDAPLGVGTKVSIRQPRLPRNTWKVTVWEPGRRFTWEASPPGVTTVADHVLEPGPDGGTRATLSVRTAGFLAPVLDVLTGSMARRYVGLEASGLERACVRPR